MTLKMYKLRTFVAFYILCKTPQNIAEEHKLSAVI